MIVDGLNRTSHQYVLDSAEFAAIERHYEGKQAERTGVPYIQHIIEGLYVLDEIDASINARLAYCLHPLTQADEDLAVFAPAVASGPEILVNAIEYRNCANRYLSFHYGRDTRRARLSPLADVNDMLIADKVQNRKDFETFHKGSHKDSDRLDAYFKEWLDVLGVDEDRYQSLRQVITDRTLKSTVGR